MLPNITAVDLDIIDMQDTETLAEWAFLIANDKWPEDLPGEEPLEKYDYNSRRYNLKRIITARIGNRPIQKYRLTKLNIPPFSETQFNDWWRAIYEDDKEAENRYNDWKLRSR